MKIERSVIWRGRTGDDKTYKTYFHPRCAVLGERGRLMMTLQEISGSDYFHPVLFSFSDDGGHSWSDPVLIPDMGRKERVDGVAEGVCDVVPEYHAHTNSLIAIGHNVYYKDGRLFDTMGDFHKETGPRLQRFPVYNVMDASGKWLPKRKQLFCDELEDASIYSCGCSQKVILDDGKIIIPLTFGIWGRKDRMVTSVLCEFDGEDLTALRKGATLELPVGRGLLEPSITRFEGRFFMTIRAEDGHGHVSTSSDGLAWSPIKSWRWDDGEELTMSTTQQHWLRHKGALYLVYNRKTEENAEVIRWRSPLYIAEVDVEALCLKRETEQVVFPLVGDVENDPRGVPLMGNFHPLEITDDKAIVTVGDMVPGKTYVGDTLIAFLE